MLSEWKNWIANRLRRRKPQRRRVGMRFRGQLESLESRNVLSATYGDVSFEVVEVHVEPTSVTIVAQAQFKPGFRPDELAPSYAASRYHFDPRGPLAVTSGFGGKGYFADGGPFGIFDRLFYSHPPVVHPSFYANPYFDGTKPDGVDIENPPNDGGPNGELRPPVGLTDAGVVSDSRPAAANGFNAQSSLQIRFVVARSNHSNYYLSTAFTTDPATDSLNSFQQTSVKSHDAAFESLASDSLLLAVNSDWDDDQFSVDAKDKLDSLSETSARDESSAEPVIAADLAKSLDTLEREQAAVDVVLAELHDIKLSDRGESSTDTEPSHRQPIDVRSREVVERFFMAHGTDAAFSPHDEIASGMILLAATGDANSSAFDLLPTSTDASAVEAIASATVDAPVGVYQAVDVGVRTAATVAAEKDSTARNDAIASR